MELREDTIDTKTSMINKYILPYFGDMLVKDIDEIVIKKWKDWMRAQRTKEGNPFSQTYLRSIHNQLCAIFNYAVKRNYIEVSPLIDTKKLGKKHAEEMQVWTPEEFNRFDIQSMEHPETYCLYQLYFWCGLRRGEGLSLKLSNLHLKEAGQSFITVTNSRNARNITGDVKTTGSKRIVPIPDFLAENLREHIAGLYNPKPEDNLFNIRIKTVYTNFHSATEAAGLKKICLHDLRHSFATMLICSASNSGHYFSPADVAKYLGHATATTTLRTYAHSYASTRTILANTLDTLKKEVDNNVG